MEVDPTISAPRESAARDFYLAYLRTSDWTKRRTRALQRAKYRCEGCGSKRSLQVHHLTYERLGDELDTDLKVLCVRCHEDEHPKHAEHEYLGLYLRIASDVLTDETRQEADVDLLEDLKRRCARLNVPYSSEKLGRALEIVRQRLPRSPEHKPAVDRYVDARWNAPVTDHDARQLLRKVGLLAVVDKHRMPQVTPLSRAKADAMIALKQIMAAIADQAQKCDEAENVLTDLEREQEKAGR